MKRILSLQIPLVIISASLLSTCQQNPEIQSETFQLAEKNAALSQESFQRCYDLTRAWMEVRDPETGLIPSNLTRGKDLWEPHNAAADNYAFMVLTAYLLDRESLNGPLRQMLETERKLSSRIGSLTDTWSFSKDDFQYPEADINRIIFASSEYMKDGLMPLSEYMGPSPWQDRMLEILDDLGEYYSVLEDPSVYDRQSAMDEVNGEMMQVLARVYWMTGDPRYLERARAIADHYLLGPRDMSRYEYLRLRDHGCEVIGGLSEVYAAMHFADPEHKEKYRPGLYRLLDRVLEAGRNEDGLFYDAINAKTGEVLRDRTADTWGYTFNAYYTVYMIDDHQPYRQAFLDGMRNLNSKYRNFDWENGSHDGYADALESGINLYNREPLPELGAWIDSEMKVMWGMQQDNGLIEGWHGDGNFSRTAIMYALWKTQGLTLDPWHPEVSVGAVMEADQLYAVIRAGKDYGGRVRFDDPRHRVHLNLPIDYPRINQFPEWFTLDQGRHYRLISSQKELAGDYDAGSLSEGLPVQLREGEILYLQIRLPDK